MKLFGSSGIRGLVWEEFTPQLALDIGAAVGTMCKGHDVVIGWDVRTSSPCLSNALTSGLLATGCDVHSVGLTTTPTLARATKGFACGLMVTASHNPPEHNGVKMWNPDGMAFDTVQMNQVEERLVNRGLSLASWDRVGRVHEYPDALKEHMETIVRSIKSLKLKVVVDCGNGSACLISPQVFRELGCDVISLNAQPDGHFPGRMPEPTEENLSLLKKTVKDTGADLGIAHDGDGDRMVAVDENGNYVGGDKLLALFAIRETKRKIVVPIDTSMIIDHFLEGKVVRTKVGDVFISEKVKEHGADFGGEPSGTWIFPKETLCPDGIYAAARLAKIVEDEGKLSQQLASIPEFPIIRGSLQIDKQEMCKVMDKLKEKLGNLDYIEMSSIDGVRLQFKDSWFLVRPSGTEAKLRITVEGVTKRKAKELYEKVVKLVKQAGGLK